jgi:MraZ protein
MISPSLISYSSLKRETLIIGMINKIEIWNPDILEKVDKNNINNDPNEFNALSDKIVL